MTWIHCATTKSCSPHRARDHAKRQATNVAEVTYLSYEVCMSRALHQDGQRLFLGSLSSSRRQEQRVWWQYYGRRSQNTQGPVCSNVFLEGISLQEAGGSFSAIQASQGANGYELLRQLTLEYSLRTRSEALSMRAGLASRTFSLSAAETSPTTVVSDVIRRIDFEAARFAKIVATLPSHVDQNG